MKIEIDDNKLRAWCAETAKALRLALIAYVAFVVVSGVLFWLAIERGWLQ